MQPAPSEQPAQQRTTAADDAAAARVVFDGEGAARVATILLDSTGKSVNTLSRQMWAALDAAISEVERASPAPAGVIIASAKPKSFIAGADLFEMRDMSRDQLDDYLKDGQRILNRLESLPMQTVAAINGDALGGGLEVALACRVRIAVDDPKIKIGLPETTLGLVPGWGGTVRLARLIGLSESLPLMAQGKTLSPEAARKIGVVKEVVAHEQLMDRSREAVLRRPEPSGSAAGHAEDQDPSRRNTLFAKIESSIRARSDDSLPAPLRLLDIVRTSYERGIEAGFDAERRALIELRETEAGRNLMRMFFLRTGAKKRAAERAGGKARDIATAAVIGGGTMGAGIAHTLVRAGLGARVIEVNGAAAEVARARIDRLIEDDARARRIDASAVERLRGLFRATDEWVELEQIDLVIEAVIEDLDTKREVFGRLDQRASPQAIFASNTSSLSVAEIAQATKSPARVIGLHFFNPVPKMLLVEVVRGPQSHPVAVATGVALAARVGKTPVIVNDSPGFLVNRVLFPYLAEALRMATSADAILKIDTAMNRWGWPMGPFELMDTIGLDVTLMILHALQPKLGERFAAPEFLRCAVANGWLGTKSGRGFYVHPVDRIAPQVFDEMARELPAGTELPSDEREIQDRLMRVMSEEVRRVLDEGVVDSPDIVDLALVLGLGFPAHRSGFGAAGAAT